MSSVHRNSQNSGKVIPSRSGYHCNINATDGGLAFGEIGCVSCALFEEDPDPLVTYMSTFLRDSPLSNDESSARRRPGANESIHRNLPVASRLVCAVCTTCQDLIHPMYSASSPIVLACYSRHLDLTTPGAVPQCSDLPLRVCFHLVEHRSLSQLEGAESKR